MEVDYSNPDDIGGNPAGAGPSAYSTAWITIPLHRCDVTDEISGSDALAVLLASLYRPAQASTASCVANREAPGGRVPHLARAAAVPTA